MALALHAGRHVDVSQAVAVVRVRRPCDVGGLVLGPPVAALHGAIAVDPCLLEELRAVVGFQVPVAVKPLCRTRGGAGASLHAQHVPVSAHSRGGGGDGGDHDVDGRCCMGEVRAHCLVFRRSVWCVVTAQHTAHSTAQHSTAQCGGGCPGRRCDSAGCWVLLHGGCD
eukprot:SAG25_NODE_385_length_8737_cov_82.994675_13_plen_168_part_00